MIFRVCETSFTRDGGGAIATTNDHEPPTSPFFFFGNPTGQAPSSTQATVGFSHVRRTHKHVIRHRLTGHETTHNAKPTVKRARHTRAHDARRHVPRNSHGPTQARRTNISRVRHTTNTRVIVFTNTTTQQSFFTQTQLYTRDAHECATTRKRVTHDAYDSTQTRHVNIPRARRRTKTRAKPEAPPHDDRSHNTRGHTNAGTQTHGHVRSGAPEFSGGVHTRCTRSCSNNRAQQFASNRTNTNTRATTTNEAHPRKQAHIHDEHSHNHGYTQRAHRPTRNDRAHHDTRAAPPLSRAIPAAHEITNTKHKTRQNRTKYMEISES